MRTDLRIVLDTNVVISALLLKHSVARQAFDRAHQLGKLLISRVTVGELHDVLCRKDFEKYITEEERIEFITAYIRDAILIDIVERVTVCRDASDNAILELALNGKAYCIVSGDEDLLVLHPFHEIAILTPRQFLDLAIV